MARNIAANSEEAWRAVIVFKSSNGKIWYEYEGIYNTRGIAKGRVSYWRGHSARFYDGWVERAQVIWERVKD